MIEKSDSIRLALATFAILGQPPRLKFLFIFVFFVVGVIAQAKPVDYIYVNASEGSSSGGHTAILFDREIFHFQYSEPGVIRLAKHESDYFQFSYRFLDNRTLNLARIDVSEQTFDLLRERFNLQYLVQRQQWVLLDELKQDRNLLNWLSANLADSPTRVKINPIRFKAAGLFYAGKELGPHNTVDFGLGSFDSASPSSVTVSHLRKQFEELHGHDYLVKKASQIRKKIRYLSPTRWDSRSLDLAKDRLPPMIYAFSSQYSNLLTGTLALEVLQQGRPLRAQSYSIPPQPEFKFTVDEVDYLRALQERLTVSVLDLMESGRPDWGIAMLINIARLITLEKSISLGRLVILDTFETDSSIIDQQAIRTYRGQIQSLAEEAREAFAQARSRINTEYPITERDYSVLEQTANRYIELSEGLSLGSPIRLNASLVPGKSIAYTPMLRPEISEHQLKQGLLRLNVYEDRLRDELEQLYGYNLFTRNCVTEIFQTIDHALFNAVEQENPISNGAVSFDQGSAEQIRTESEKRLGGYMDINLINSIPFTSFDFWQNTFPVSENRTLLSFRQVQLKQMYRKENDIVAYLSEANVLTSTLYQHHSDDSFFLFFTDDATLLRPVFGAVNTMVGLTGGILGVLMFPFDSGKWFYSGTKGILMSIPELFFFNIRKGSYKYLPYQKLINNSL